MKKKVFVALLVVLVLLIGTACGGNAPQPNRQEDRTILSMGPASTEILVALGMGDHIVGVDTFSGKIAGLPSDLPAFDMMAPDVEQMIALGPDVIFAAGITQVDGLDPFEPLTEMGVKVVHLPWAVSIADIQADIRLIAATVDAEAEGEALIAEMEQEIAEIQAAVAEIEAPQTVYFEIGAPPFLFSFGQGVFLHEMLELVGAVNVFADQDAWFAPADEAVLDANADVILTNVGYVEDPVEDILTRPGWDVVTAVRDGRVYFIDPDSSSRPSHHIVQAMWEMARAVHPELFG